MSPNLAFPWIFLSISFFSCHKAATPPDAGTPQAITAAQDIAALPQYGGSLADQLSAEAAHRPKNGLTLEAIAAHLVAKGHTVSDIQGTQGRSWRALYCATAKTGEGLILTTCEYATPAHAQRALDDFQRLTRNMPTGVAEQVGPTIVMLTSTSDAAAALRDELKASLAQIPTR